MFSNTGLCVSMWSCHFLRAAIGPIRRQNLHSVLLWMDGQESMEAFDFAFGPMTKYDLDVLRTLTLTGKVFQVFLPSPGVEEPVAADRWLLQRA